MQPIHMHTVFAGLIPGGGLARTTRQVHIGEVPFHTGVSPAVEAQRKLRAELNRYLPMANEHFLPRPNGKSLGVGPLLTLDREFSGMQDGTVCQYFGGSCAPPDGAIAASKFYVVEALNTSIAVYSPTGVLHAGWPKNTNNFFGIPAPGACDTNGPFTSDPRAFYDSGADNFVIAFLQVEGGLIGNSCPNSTTYWIAVSATPNPTGAWFIYAFNMDPTNAGNAADFTQVGFSHTSLCFSGNMFSQTSGSYQYAETFCAPKEKMNHGKGVTAFGFLNLTDSNGTVVDTVQPVDTLSSVNGDPGVQFFANTYNITSGGGQCSTGCSTMDIWAMSNPGSSSETLQNVPLTIFGYSLAPSASEPGCSNCLDTDDTRISGTPVYRAGNIYAAFNAAFNNGAQIVDGVGIEEAVPRFSGGTLSVSQGEFGGVYGLNDGASDDLGMYYGETVTDSSNNLAFVFTLSGNTAGIDPSVDVATHNVTDCCGAFSSLFGLVSGAAATPDFRMGDYNAATWDGNDRLWVEGEFTPSTSDWGSGIGRVQF
jgi:hypothetical protein